MSDELKPCPFCGGLAEIVDIDEGENAGGSCVCCTTCLASSKVEFGFKENFISNWNRRVQTLAPDAFVRLWHAARLGLDMARANDLTKTAETIMEAMNAVECTCNGSDEMCPCQNRRPAPDPEARLVEAARGENERLQTIIDNLHAVEQKHRETANAEFHRANRLQVENERLREALKGMDLEAQRETVEAMLKPTLIHLVMKMSDDARATLAIMTGAAKGASDGGL